MKFIKTKDNHLEHMGKFKNEIYVLRMDVMRKEFIKLDNELREIVEDEEVNPHAMRTVALARTHLETALQYAIKTICILGQE